MTTDVHHNVDHAQFLAGGGELGALTRAYDWAGSSLGAPAQWPQSLRTAVRLMLNSRHPMFIWWGPDLIQFYNDAYRETMGPERHPSALGDKGRDCWAESWPIIGPQIEFVMRGKGATWQEDQLVPVTRFGSLQDVWWTYGYSPIDAYDGVGGVLVVCKDVTREHLAREALSVANRRLSDDVGSLREMFSQAPGFIAVLTDPDHVFRFANNAYLKMVGRDSVVGKPVREVLPDVEGQGYFETLDTVYRTGSAHVGSGVLIKFQPERNGPVDELYLDFVYQPIRDKDGKVFGIFVEGYDVTARVEIESHRKLVVDEMNHRVKNTFATVQALALLAGKSALTVEEFQGDLTQRIASMARTQNLLIEGYSQPVSVHDVLVAELEPYGMGDQASLECVEVMVGPHNASSLGLLVHELATNAAKYGALSGLGGRLSVNCQADGLNGTMIWTETFGQPIVSPVRTGFGTRLIQRLARDLGGSADINLTADGLTATITFRLKDQQVNLQH